MTSTASDRPAGHYAKDYRLDLRAAALSSPIAASAFLVAYYASLPLLPIAWASATPSPVPAWGERFDLCQYYGTFLKPPYPTLETWWIGLAALLAVLIGAGGAYALLLSWSGRRSTAARGLSLGVALFLAGGLAIWAAPGVHPALMRNALPDPGFFWLGWSGWATLQNLFACAVFGAVLGEVFRRSS